MILTLLGDSSLVRAAPGGTQKGPSLLTACRWANLLGPKHPLPLIAPSLH
jgi:hypothetical protein